MKPGFYKAEWWGQNGTSYGFGVVAFFEGLITGTDAAGVNFDGEYEIPSEDLIQVKWLKAAVPPNVSLAQGGPVLDMPHVIDIPPFTLDSRDELERVIEVPTQPTSLIVRFTLLRRFGK